MKKQTVLFCTGIAGSGKSYFIKHFLPQGAFYNLKSATTRPMRAEEQDNREYYFRDETYFNKEKFATYLWVNEAFWKEGMPKWLYGVPEFEILNNLGKNFTYDVIQPRYVAEMINWFKSHNLDKQYKFKILWFQPNENSANIVEKRKNMPNDIEVRKSNTCNLQDFKNVGINPNHRVISNPYRVVMDKRLQRFLEDIQKQYS